MTLHWQSTQFVIIDIIKGIIVLSLLQKLDRNGISMSNKVDKKMAKQN